MFYFICHFTQFLWPHKNLKNLLFFHSYLKQKHLKEKMLEEIWKDLLSFLLSLDKHLYKVWGQVEKKKNKNGMSVSAYPVFIYVAIFLCEEYHITRYKPYKVWLDVIWNTSKVNMYYRCKEQVLYYFCKIGWHKLRL